jgi:hypothetical protein
MTKDRLVTIDYCGYLLQTSYYFFAFYLILPVLTFLHDEVFNANNATVGIILSAIQLQHSVSAIFRDTYLTRCQESHFISSPILFLQAFSQAIF